MDQELEINRLAGVLERCHDMDDDAARRIARTIFGFTALMDPEASSEKLVGFAKGLGEGFGIDDERAGMLAAEFHRLCVLHHQTERERACAAPPASLQS